MTIYEVADLAAESAPRFFIESQHGCYSETGWCCISMRSNLTEAIQFAQLGQPGERRVVNVEGVVLWRGTKEESLPEPNQSESYGKRLIDDVPQHLLDFVEEWNVGSPLLLYKKLDPQYLEVANSHAWDTPTEYAIFRQDRAPGGLVVYGKYPHRGWIRATPSQRDLTRILLNMLGARLPLPEKGRLE
jgi:hypothetical protein